MESEIIRYKNIVMVGLVDYEFGLGNNCRNIAEEFSKHNKVLFINPPADRSTLIKNKNNRQLSNLTGVLKGEIPPLNKISENLWVYTPTVVLESINWISVPFIHTLLNKWNNKKYAKEIRKPIKELNFNSFYLFNDNDIYKSFYLKEYLKPEKYIYYIRDNLTSMAYWRKHGLRLEKILIAKSDVVIANSTFLSASAEEFNSKTYYVGQGCDFSLFDTTISLIEPPDLSAIPHPRIGYVGNLTNLRLDLGLLEFLAIQKPDWNIVLVGPEDKVFKASSLHNYKNIYFCGAKKMEELSHYISFFDVCINPQAINPLTIGNYPRKIDEYLAMGKPVVATKTKAMEAFQKYTYLCSSNEEYIQNIGLALLEKKNENAESRRNFALQHTWENNVMEIYKAILESNK